MSLSLVMKVALCFIISYDHILHKEQLWMDWIKPNQDIINVYFHYKEMAKIRSPWIKLYTIPEKYIQKTTYFNVVPAYMSVLSYAYEHDKENVWFSMLTDSCVPIISPAKFRKMFLDNYQASVIKCVPAYWNITIHRRANLRLLKEEYWLANDPWFVLCRDHVHKCILFMTLKNQLYQQINMGGLANESIFAIILKTFGQLTTNDANTKGRTINESSTISDWTRMTNPTSPHTFDEDTEENTKIICGLLKKNKYAMFLRKIDKSYPDERIKEIMEMDFGHTYDTLYNTATQKSKQQNVLSSRLQYIALFLFLFFAIAYTKLPMNHHLFSQYM